MTKTARSGGTVILVAIVLGALTLLAARCSSADEQATTTTAAVSSVTTIPASSVTTLPTSSDGVQRLVVGGATVEEYEAALPDLEKAVEAAPDDLAALQELAIAQYNTSRYEEAAVTYRKMLQLKDDAFTHNNYGNVLRDLKKIEEAKAEYEKAISADASLAAAYFNLASVLAAQGNTTDALKVVDRGLTVITGEDKTRLETYKEQLSAKK
ncbi:MAG: tetratricopeptide repeat protein [bacterium]